MTEASENEVTKRKMSKGCLIGIVALGVALLILILSLIYVPGMLREKMKASYAEVESNVKNLNPPGYTSERIHALFENSLMAFDSGWASPEVTKGVLRALTEAYLDDTLTVDEAVAVLQTLESVNLPQDSSQSEDSLNAAGSSADGAETGADETRGK